MLDRFDDDYPRAALAPQVSDAAAIVTQHLVPAMQGADNVVECGQGFCIDVDGCPPSNAGSLTTAWARLSFQLTPFLNAPGSPQWEASQRRIKSPRLTREQSEAAGGAVRAVYNCIRRFAGADSIVYEDLDEGIIAFDYEGRTYTYSVFAVGS